MKTNLPCVFLAGFVLGQAWAHAAAEFRPGETWLDTAGKPIQAHGGGILVQSNVFYWYGEDRTLRNRTTVSCYSSTNLYDWKHEGVVFGPDAFPPDLRGTFIERPKVIFNARTGKYVLWMHLERGGYHYARAGIAVAAQAAGPFSFVQSVRPISEDTGFKENDPDQQPQFGGTYRDMNVFVDDDSRAYTFYASEGNWTMYVVRLNDEFTGPEKPAVQGKTWARILVRKMREAPAPFKCKGRYYVVTSGCTGWAPNAADYAVADHVLGPWTSKGNPCVGTNANTTFGTQSTFVLPLAAQPGCFIFMADRWSPRQLPDSRYVWLPLMLKPDGGLTLEWRPAWKLSVFGKD
jgi:hypothetical protein